VPLTRGEASAKVPWRMSDHEDAGTLANLEFTIESVNATVVLEGIDCASAVSGPNQATITAETSGGGIFWATFESVADGAMFQQWRGAMLLRQGEGITITNSCIVSCACGVSAWGYILPGGPGFVNP
jgi:hypothetical protein